MLLPYYTALYFEFALNTRDSMLDYCDLLFCNVFFVIIPAEAISLNENLHLSDYENHFPDISFFNIVLLHNGRECCASGKTTGFSISDHYLFHLVLSGRGRLCIEKQHYSIGQGEGFLIRPGQLYQYIADEKEPWEYLWIGFGGKDVEMLLYNSRLLHTSPIYQSDDWRTLRTYMESSLSAVKKGEAGALVYCQGMLLLIISHLLKNTLLFQEPRDLTKMSDVQMKYVRDAISFIQTHLGTFFTASDVSDALGLNRSYFSRLFTRISGISLSKFIENYRLDSAWHILRHSDTQISKIAQAVGYHDAAYFTRRFQARYGLSPSEVRMEGNKFE